MSAREPTCLHDWQTANWIMIEIFLFPILLLVITFLTGKENIKYVLTHSKSFLTNIQYNLMIDAVLGFILFVEVYVIYASFV